MSDEFITVTPSGLKKNLLASFHLQEGCQEIKWSSRAWHRPAGPAGAEEWTGEEGGPAAPAIGDVTQTPSLSSIRDVFAFMQPVKQSPR